MSADLATYLNDHLAGARFATDLLERIRDANADKPLGRFAADLLLQIEEDCSILTGIVECLEGDASTLKEAAGWLAEKASRVKLRLGSDTSLGTFEALEALALGVLGKLKLWQALSTIASQEPCLRGVDFDRLISRAQTQHDEIEVYRRDAARNALTSTPS